MAQPVLDETLERIERIQSHKNVQGLIVVNSEGNPLRTNMDNSTTLQYTRQMEDIATFTKHVVRDLDPRDELVVLRIRTKHCEIMVVPEKQQIVVCIQACDEEKVGEDGRGKNK